MTLNDRETYVVHTMVMRLSEVNSLRYLEHKGYKIKISTYRAVKKRIRDGGEQRKFDLIRDGLWESHVERLDNLELCLKEAWIKYNNEQDSYKGAKILSIIASIQPLLSTYYSQSQKVFENDSKLKKLLTQ